MATIPTGKYLHYKGREYRVLGTVLHSETMEELVLYQPLYGEMRLWVRPLEMFLENIEVDGSSIARFKFIEAQEGPDFAPPRNEI